MTRVYRYPRRRLLLHETPDEIDFAAQYPACLCPLGKATVRGSIAVTGCCGQSGQDGTRRIAVTGCCGQSGQDGTPSRPKQKVTSLSTLRLSPYGDLRMTRG